MYRPLYSWNDQQIQYGQYLYLPSCFSIQLKSLGLTQFAAFWFPGSHPKACVWGRVWRVWGSPPSLPHHVPESWFMVHHPSGTLTIIQTADTWDYFALATSIGTCSQLRKSMANVNVIKYWWLDPQGQSKGGYRGFSPLPSSHTLYAHMGHP